MRAASTNPAAAIVLPDAGIGARPALRLFLERVLTGIFGGLVVVFLLDDTLFGLSAVRAVAVRMLLVRGDELGEHARERVDLMAPELRARGEVRRLLGEHALQPEHQREVDLPSR